MMNGQTYGDAGQQRGSSTVNGSGSRIPAIDATRKPGFIAGEYRAAHYTPGAQSRQSFGLREHRPAYRQMGPDGQYDLSVSVPAEIKRRVDRTDWAGIATKAENQGLLSALLFLIAVGSFRIALLYM